MKKCLPLMAGLLFTTAGSFAQTVEDANVLLGNLSGSLYWDSYDDATKIVDNLNFSVYADGTNSSYYTPAFTIKVYLWDGSNPTFVHTFNDPGIPHFGSRDYTNEDIDISDNGLPAGSYRLGVFVDADDDIPDSEDDPSDNAYLAPGNIDYTPGSGSTAGLKENDMNTLMVFPNPATEQVFVTWENTMGGIRSAEITDMNGRVMESLQVASGSNKTKISVSQLPAGTYFIRVTTDQTVMTQKFIKS